MNEKKNTVGCPPKLTEEDADHLLHLYRERNPKGKISSRFIWKFTLELLEERVIEHAPSEDFWSKKGRIGYKVIEGFKDVEAPVTILLENRGSIAPKISDLVKKKHYTKEELEVALYPLEEFANKTLKKLITQTEELEKLQQEISGLNKDKRSLQVKVRAAEEAVLLLYLYIQKESNKTTKELTQRALENIYKHPNPLDLFNDYMRRSEPLSEDSSSPSKVAKLSELARLKKNNTK